ncbi:hypothetical protein RB594_005958 [Gaeumannomyces avenae]
MLPVANKSGVVCLSPKLRPPRFSRRSPPLVQTAGPLQNLAAFSLNITNAPAMEDNYRSFAPLDELCDKLLLINGSITRKPSCKTVRQQHLASPPIKTCLPGSPRTQLEAADMATVLGRELLTKDLDRLSPHLWLVAKQDSTHVSSLTQQIVRGRRITITEDPGLHLVWAYDRVFVKPLPEYLLSHAFWEHYLFSDRSPLRDPARRRELRRAARGFLRSYAFLIRHPSDFALATGAVDGGASLIPRKVRYADFLRFVDKFLPMRVGAAPDDKNSFDDEDADADLISRRYQFGELRLTRLSFWSKIFLRTWVYRKEDWQYSDALARFYAPLLFVFGVLSVVTSAAQVVLQAGVAVGLGFAAFAHGFGIVTLVLLACIVLAVVFVVLVMALREISFALRDKDARRRSRLEAKQRVALDSGVP